MIETPTVPESLTQPTNGSPDIAGEMQRFMQHVYGWMALALVISGGIAYYVANDITILTLIFENGLFYPLILIELGLVIALSWGIKKMNAITATVLFVLYSLFT
jgi:FtsH-binding integral membrane protein